MFLAIQGLKIDLHERCETNQPEEREKWGKTSGPFFLKPGLRFRSSAGCWVIILHPRAHPSPWISGAFLLLLLHRDREMHFPVTLISSLI